MNLLANPNFWTVVAGVLGALVGGGFAWWLARRQRMSDDRQALNGVLSRLIPALKETESQYSDAREELSEVYFAASTDRHDEKSPSDVFRERASAIWKERRLGQEAEDLADIACLVSGKRDKASAESLRGAIRSAVAVPIEDDVARPPFHHIRRGIENWIGGRAPDFTAGMSLSVAEASDVLNAW